MSEEKSAEYFIPGQDELDPEKPSEVINFNINDARIAEAAEQYKEVDAYKDIDAAKAAKGVLTKFRTTLAEAHKEQKAESLAYGRKLDAEKNRLLGLIAEIEDPIKTQLDEIKNTEARKEEDRISEIEHMMDSIRSYGHELDGLEVIDLQKIQSRLASLEIIEEDYQEFVVSAEGVKAESESRLRIAINSAQKREEAQARLETQHKKQEAKQKELDQFAADLARDASKQRAEQEKKDKAAREKQATEDAERQAEIDRKFKEQAAELNKQAEEQDAKQAEIDAREAAELLAAEAEVAAARTAELAPDKEKLRMLADKITNLHMPTVTSEEGQGILSMVTHSLEALCQNIRNRTGEME